ncbi:MAG: GTP cyclohydrolase II [archaeon]|nr:GTP cyclohydrolase II [Candidatus Micrarchaeota archaeon]
MNKISFDSIPSVIKDLEKGRMVILVDDEARENEGDLVFAAQFTSPEKINFMTKHGRGLVCVPITSKRAEKLNLQLMTDSKGVFGTAFTVSVDAKKNISTGTSAFDRSEAVKALCFSNNPKNLIQPGHVFPMIAKDAGVLQRAGHTEAAIDLMKLAKLKPVSVVCEIMKKDGSMARLPELIKLKKKFKLRIASVKDLIHYRIQRESLVEKISSTSLPTIYGKFNLITFKDNVYGHIYLALVKGKIKGKKNVLVRVHSACLTGDVFKSMRCDCGFQLEEALKIIEKEKSGIVLYIPHQEGRGIGLKNKLCAYELQDKGADTVEANRKLGFEDDLRDYGFGAQVLKKLGLTSIKLLTNNPRKIIGLEGYGLRAVKRIPLKVPANKHSSNYLKTKKEKLGHLL